MREQIGDGGMGVVYVAEQEKPWAYVRDLLVRLHAEETDLESMLPDHCAKDHPEAILQHRLAESRAKATAKRDRHRRRKALAKKRPR